MVRGRGPASPDVAGLADAGGLGGAVEREGLHLDDQLVLGQQVGRQGKGLHGAAVGPAPGDAGAGLAGGVVGDGHHLGRFGYKADQFLDRGLAGDVEDGVDRPAGGRPDPLGQALAVDHRVAPISRR